MMSFFVDALERRFPNLRTPTSFVNCKEQSYLDLFDKRKLIYLSPDAADFLEDWEEDEILIIGAIVDLGHSVPWTKAKAKREGIRLKKLPLDKYVVWGVATKAMPLPPVLGMLNDYQSCKDWKRAIVSNVPSRKLKSKEEIDEEDRSRAKKMRFKRKKFFKVDQELKSDYREPYRTDQKNLYNNEQEVWDRNNGQNYECLDRKQNFDHSQNKETYRNKNNYQNKIRNDVR